MTKIYFVRHSKPDFSVEDDMTRPLTIEGVERCKLVRDYLRDKEIDHIYSSPFKRSFDTVKEFAEQSKLKIEIVDDFRERKVSDCWIDDFDTFAKNQWSDFTFKLENGENLEQVQRRNIVALKKVIEKNTNRNIVIASHGTAMSTVMNYYNPSFSYKDFERIKTMMPFIVEIEFDDRSFVTMREIFLYK